MKYLVNTNHFEILQALYVTLVQQAARGPSKMFILAGGWFCFEFRMFNRGGTVKYKGSKV